MVFCKDINCLTLISISILELVLRKKWIHLLKKAAYELQIYMSLMLNAEGNAGKSFM